MSTPSDPATCVLYDGSCPLCQREIAMYQQLPAQQPIQWVDISYISNSAEFGADPAALMRRFHVVTSSGALISGARAFVHLWALLPGWKHLAACAKFPGVLTVMEVCYRIFLVIRPSLQKMVRKIVRPSKPLSHPFNPKN